MFCCNSMIMCKLRNIGNFQLLRQPCKNMPAGASRLNLQLCDALIYRLLHKFDNSRLLRLKRWFSTTNVPVTGVELDITEIGLVVGETAVLTATVLPENATDKSVTWLSSAPEIVSVDENGTVEGLAAGNATVTVTTTDGGKTAECQIQVMPATVSVTGVELDVTEIELEVGQTAVLTATVLPEDATDKTVAWSSTAPETVSVDEDGNVQALAVGDAVITVATADGGKTAECSVTVSQTINGHEYVDLGLSVKWATCNVGAENPWDYGDYFAWGETEPKSIYGPDNSVTNEMEDISDISGDPEYDAARANWGGTWRLPTEEEITEIMDNCTWEWTTEEEVSGYKVTGPNGNSVFFPAAGYMFGSTLDVPGLYGYYWGSTPGPRKRARALSFSYDSYNLSYLGRFYGQSVRPVAD